MTQKPRPLTIYSSPPKKEEARLPKNLKFLFLHSPLSTSSKSPVLQLSLTMAKSIFLLATIALASAESSVVSLFLPDVEGTALVASVVAQVRPQTR